MNLEDRQGYFVFDVESVGLHGEGFAVGWVVIDPSGRQIASAGYACPPDLVSGPDAGRAWLNENLPGLIINCRNPRHVREEFCLAWLYARKRGMLLAADCPWPVEARFLVTCIEDGLFKADEGPYPLIDVASVRLAAGLDPLATVPRLPAEMPAHDPQSDARQSARLLIEALDMIESEPRREP